LEAAGGQQPRPTLLTEPEPQLQLKVGHFQRLLRPIQCVRSMCGGCWQLLPDQGIQINFCTVGSNNHNPRALGILEWKNDGGKVMDADTLFSLPVPEPMVTC
jgi:hypothetical protein